MDLRASTLLLLPLLLGCSQKKHDMPVGDALSIGGMMACNLVDGALGCWAPESDSWGLPSMSYAATRAQVLERTPEGTFLAVDVGVGTACALRDDGRAVCWEGMGALAGPEFTSPPSIVMTDIAVGDFYGACGLDGAGALHCWGGNDPHGGPPNRAEDFETLSGIQDVSYGYIAVCIIDAAGWVHCTGGYPNASGTPTGVFTSVESGAYFHCALDLEGAPACWGRVYDAPQPVASGSFIDMDVGSHFCGVRDDHTLTCVGFEEDGPVTVDIPGSYLSVSVNDVGQGCARTTNDGVVCFGL